MGAELPKLGSVMFLLRVLDFQVTPESHLCGGIGDSRHGLSPRTVKSNQSSTFCP